jgi:hypothetical protein
MREAGVLLVLDEGDKDFKRLRISKPGQRLSKKSLYFAVFAEESVFEANDADGLERYVVKGLSSILQKTLFDNQEGPIEAGQ